MALDAPAVKSRSSLQRLKARVGLNKKLPPTPVPAVAHSAAPAEVERNEGGQGAASSSASPRDGAKVTKDYVEPTSSIGSSILTQAQQGVGLNPIAEANSENLPPARPRNSDMSRKSSNPLFRFSTRFRSNSSPDEPRPKPAAPPPLPKGLKHTKTIVRPSNSAQAQARREAALVAAGLKPAQPVKTLSQIEAEENQRVGVARSPDEEFGGASEAAELVKMWRTKSATSSLGKGADLVSRSYTPPVATSPLPESRFSPVPPASPRSHRSRRSLDRTHSHTNTDSTEKVQQWLKQSPQSSPRPDRLSKDSERERFIGYTMPRSPIAAAIPHVAPSPRATSHDLELTDSEDTEEFFSLPNSPQPPLSDHVSPTSPTSRTFSDASGQASTSTRPLPMLVTSSSVGSDTSCSAGPPTPSLPSTPTLAKPRGFSAHRGAPNGIAPIIVETSEDGVLLGGRDTVMVSPPKVANLDVSSAPASVHSFGSLRTPVPPPKNERRSSGLFFAKRTSTLPTNRAEAQVPVDLHRGATIATANGRATKLFDKATRRQARQPPAPLHRAPTLAVTMHSVASVEQSLRAIEDDEARRLSEVAYF
ncbi:hypothetical protein PENSPDRAFT_658757 [Peniophora sp. CONT]|nr:hypothetical protein PENSPDRAFT_658757 [Peniophora sp. CONT]